MSTESPASSDKSPRQDAAAEQAFAPSKHKRVLVRSSRPGSSASKRSNLAARTPAGLPPGQLHFVSPYSGAAVWINGMPVGTVPMIWESGIPGEECLVEYRMPGFDPVAFRIAFPPAGEIIECNRSLDPNDDVLKTQQQAKFSSEQAVREALNRLFLQTFIPVERQIELLDQVAQEARLTEDVLARLLHLYEALVAEMAGEEPDADLSEEEARLARMSSAGCGSFQLDSASFRLQSEGIQTTLLFDEGKADPSAGPPPESLPVETQTSQLLTTADAATSGGDLKRYLHLELVCEEMPAGRRRRKGHHKRVHHAMDTPAPDASPVQSQPQARREDGAASPSLPPLVRPMPRDSVVDSMLPVPASALQLSPSYTAVAMSPSLALAAFQATMAMSPSYAVWQTPTAGSAAIMTYQDTQPTAAPLSTFHTPHAMPTSPPLLRPDTFHSAHSPSDTTFLLLRSPSPRLSLATYLPTPISGPTPFLSPTPQPRPSLGLRPEAPVVYPTLHPMTFPLAQPARSPNLQYYVSMPTPHHASASAMAPLYPVLDGASFLGLGSSLSYPQLVAVQPRVVNFVPQQAVLDAPPVQSFAWWSPLPFGPYPTFPETSRPYFYPLL